MSDVSCNIVAWNVWSILNEQKLSNFLQVLEDQNFQIACITETWFDSQNGKFTAAIKNAGFKLIHSYREDKRGGGTAIMYRSQLKVKKGEESSSKYESFEFCYIIVSYDSANLILVCIYRKQEVQFKTFCKEFELFMDKLSERVEELLVVGDFNVWADAVDDPDTKSLMTLMNAYGLTQIVSEPTHREGHTLDHIYVNPHGMTLEHTVHNDTFNISTDHYPCIVKLPGCSQEVRNETVSLRKLKNVDMSVFRTKIKEIADRVVNPELGFEDSYNELKIPAEKLLNELAPVTTQVVRRNNSPKWVDEEFRKARAVRRKLEKKWRRNKSVENHQCYIEQRSLCAELSLSKQQTYYSNVVEKASNKQKSLFKVVNEVLDKKPERILPTHTDPTTLANEFNQYYIDKIDKLRETIPPTHSETQPEKIYFKGEKLVRFAPTTNEEVKELIQEFGVKTSSEDPIPAALISSAMDELLPVYVDLVNKSLAEGTMNGIKHSEIDPLLKKHGLDSDIKKNYRPVNNLVFLSKLTERIVAKRLDDHMRVNNLFTEEFFGYKKHHNTEMMMLGVADEILTGFDNDECTVMLFIDLSAAFDTIDIDRMVEILGDEIGLAGEALSWCKSFLSNRTQRVKINGHYSDKLVIKFGTVQGSVLGPKFFNIYVRSQPRVFRNCGFKSTAFADDSNGRKTFAVSFQYNILVNDVKNCIEQITAWSYTLSLKINPDKTEMILFHPKSMKHRVIIGGTVIGEECIRYSKEVKNVGAWLDQHLDMNKQINNIVSQSYKSLQNIGRVRNILTNKHTEMLVHSVMSRLDYCNSLLFNISKSKLLKLQKVQNAAARLVVRSKRRTPISSTLKKLHWLRVESRIIFKLLLLMFKCIHGQSAKIIEIKYKTHNCRPQDYLLLETRKVKTKYGKRAFSYAGPMLWNALPLAMRMEENVEVFKKEVKTMLFEGTDMFKKRAFKYV